MRIRLCLTLSLMLCTPLSPAWGAERPNVVLVITDDQGYGDLGCHGNPVLKTPEIDALFKESVRLADYHVAPTCSPTRAALMTGNWTDRTGVWHTVLGRSLLKENFTTMGQIFQNAGYTTGMFGKWHLGDNYPYRAEDRGFAEVLRHGGGGVGQISDAWNNAYFGGSYFHNSRPVPVEGFCTDVFFDAARQFIKKQKAAKQPFLAYIATNAPHGPMHAPPESSVPYQNLPVDLANFFGMIANIDDNVGRLRAFLAEEGLAQNTIFIFTTDNGTAAGDSINNGGMRGKKGSEYDGGHRVPFFVYWPEGGLTGGRDVNPITAHVDVLPTLIDLCGIPVDSSIHFDGRSIKPLLSGNTVEWPDRILVTDSQRVKDPVKWKQTAVMTSQWRLVNGKELYEIAVDPLQKSNVIKQHPEVVNRLTQFYDAWWEELEPSFKEDALIYLGHPAENPASLTSHDWITEGLPPWNQGDVRKGLAGKSNMGYWNVKVVEDGDYEIRLRRWPVAADAPLDASLSPGDPVPGGTAFRSHPGKAIPIVHATIEVGDQKAAIDVPSGAREAVFRLPLKAGVTRLNARFQTGEGQEVGAYYAYVERLTSLK